MCFYLSDQVKASHPSNQNIYHGQPWIFKNSSPLLSSILQLSTSFPVSLHFFHITTISHFKEHISPICTIFKTAMNEIKICFHLSLQLYLEGLQQCNFISHSSSSCLSGFQSMVNLPAPPEQHGHHVTDLSQGQLKYLLCLSGRAQQRIRQLPLP